MISAGHVGDITSVTSWTPLKITHLPRVEYWANTPRQLHRGHPNGDLRYRRLLAFIVTKGANALRRRGQRGGGLRDWLLGRPAEFFGMCLAVVLSQHLANLAGRAGDRAVADVAARDRA